ncbi:MAG: MerR family transcriptional regulator [Chloroflexi bacterium]|nr:MerR family transcriptional regulator [Chloroflexota bacterium]
MNANADADSGIARYQIGEVADRTGVTQRTLRFYEEKGLLRPPERMDGGFRLYSENDVTRIGYIKQLQDLLGFTLSEIKDMVEAEELLMQMSVTRRPDRELPERLQRSEQILGALTKQLDVVDHKVEHLTLLREELRAKMARITQRRTEILNALEQEQAVAEL